MKMLLDLQRWLLSEGNVCSLDDYFLTIVDKKARKRGSVYMVTPYMDHDLAGLLENPKVQLKVPHIKSYMKQLLQGTAYLHEVASYLTFIN